MNKRKIFIFTTLLLLYCLGSLVGCSKKSADPVSKEEPPKPQFSLSDFQSAEACKDCHPTYYNEWRGSMHAYAFVDPINTIGMKNTQIAVGAEELGQFCLECHSPIGPLTGETPTGFNKENVDPKIKEGINCDVCHLMEFPSETASHNPVYHYDVKSGTQYGSIMAPAHNSFHPSEGKQFYSQSKVCLPCHDLINKTGLPVEITFTEWLESPFSAMGVECQDCHMETYSGQAAVDGPQRENLHRHDFIGVDIALIDDFPNIAEQRQKIEQLLQNSVSLTVNVQDSIRANSTLEIETIVKNDKTGHDIPSSVTFVRQMWLEVTVSNGSEILYKSGYFDDNGDLMDEHSVLNPNGDPDLALFQSALFKNGEPANVFEADSIRIGSIAPFQSKTNVYSVALPSYIGTSIEVKVRLRFRTFPPSAVRDDAPELIDKIPVFEMEEFLGTVIIL
jgi:hypothetical protein